MQNKTNNNKTKIYLFEPATFGINTGLQALWEVVHHLDQGLQSDLVPSLFQLLDVEELLVRKNDSPVGLSVESSQQCSTTITAFFLRFFVQLLPFLKLIRRHFQVVFQNLSRAEVGHSEFFGQLSGRVCLGAWIPLDHSFSSKDILLTSRCFFPFSVRVASSLFKSLNRVSYGMSAYSKKFRYFFLAFSFFMHPNNSRTKFRSFKFHFYTKKHKI
jgi:hypothetical protein